MVISSVKLSFISAFCEEVLLYTLPKTKDYFQIVIMLLNEIFLLMVTNYLKTSFGYLGGRSKNFYA